MVVSESAGSLSSVFVHQALLPDLYIQTSGSFRQIYVNEYGIDRPVSRGRELAVLAACTAGPHGLWADLHRSSLVDLRRQADAAQQLLIARIGTEAVECGVHFQK